MQKGILKGVDEIIDDILGVTSIGKTLPHYRNKEACDRLHHFPPQSFAAADLLKQVSDKIEDNWKGRLHNKQPSKENWHFEPKKYIAKTNPSLEVQLERAIVNINQNMWPDAVNWTNQVPTASGLWDHKYDRRRAIDLVHVLPGQNRYDAVEFIELKVNRESGYPLYAAIEVLLYGMLYIFSRRHFKELKYDLTMQPLLQAKAIHLVVLAPYKYYDGYQFDWLEGEITDGLRRFIEPESYTMDFQFQAFPWDCSFEKSIPDEALIIKALKDRSRVEAIGQQWRNEAKRLECEADGVLAMPRSWAGKNKTRRAQPRWASAKGQAK
ncbi:MAG: hypothetical protein CV088_07240 [Nitrospira sp. LK70]|nr:hypothetical protein [Nitrospira sp. LK70]